MLNCGFTEDGKVIILFSGKKEDGEPFTVRTEMKPAAAKMVVEGLQEAIRKCEGN